VLQVASQARLMSYGLRKLAANAHKTNTTVMFINQLRHKVRGAWRCLAAVMLACMGQGSMRLRCSMFAHARKFKFECCLAAASACAVVLVVSQLVI
jgi:hypothetical protein